MSIKWRGYTIEGESNVNYFNEYKGRSDCEIFSATGKGKTSQYYCVTKNTQLVANNLDQIRSYNFVLVKNGERYYFIKPLNKLYLRFHLSRNRYCGLANVPRGDSSSWYFPYVKETGTNGKFGLVDYRFKYEFYNGNLLLYTDSLGKVGAGGGWGGWSFDGNSSASCNVGYTVLLNGKKTSWGSYPTHESYMPYNSMFGGLSSKDSSIYTNLYLGTVSNSSCSGWVNSKGDNGASGSMWDWGRGWNGGVLTSCAIIMSFVNRNGDMQVTSDSDSQGWGKTSDASVSANSLSRTWMKTLGTLLKTPNSIHYEYNSGSYTTELVPGTTQNKTYRRPVIAQYDHNDGVGYTEYVYAI